MVGKLELKTHLELVEQENETFGWKIVSNCIYIITSPDNLHISQNLTATKYSS